MSILITLNGDPLSEFLGEIQDYDIHPVDPYELSDREVYGPEFEGLAPFEPSKAIGVMYYRCCDSGSCNNRKHNNVKAVKPKAKK